VKFVYLVTGGVEFSTDDEAEARAWAEHEATEIVSGWPTDATVNDLDAYLAAVRDVTYSASLAALVRAEVARLRPGR
jgi:hypothetical protein